MRRPRITAAWLFAALAVAGAAIFVAWTGVQDVMRLRTVRASVAPGALPVGKELQVVRSMLEETQAFDQEPWWRHIWVRTVGGSARTQTQEALAAALEHAGALTEGRQSNREWLAQQRAALEQAGTLAAAKAVLAAVEHGPPDQKALLPAQETDPVLALARQRVETLAAEDQRNAQALDQAAAALADASSNPARLLQVAHAVLPFPDRTPPDRQMAMDALRQEAAARRNALLAKRASDARRAGTAAGTAAEVAQVLQALESDPDFQAGADNVATYQRTRQALHDRKEALERWEAGVARVRASLEAPDPVAATRALGALQPPDETLARALGQMRVVFPEKLTNSLAYSVLLHARAGDWAGAHREVALLLQDPTLRPLLNDAAVRVVRRASILLDQAEDRALYEAFRQSPCRQLADRYLAGWPATARRMAPLVKAYRDALERPTTIVQLVSVDWDDVGQYASTIADMPDATIELGVPGTSLAKRVLPDVQNRSRTVLEEPLQVVLDGPDDEPVRLLAAVKLDLRDTALADPVAVGGVQLSPADMRAVRRFSMKVLDPGWSPRPHHLNFSALPAGAPALPPWEAPQAPAVR